MNDAQAEALASLSALIDKIALELVFAQPASDAGLLPINSFIIELEDTAQSNPPSEPIRAAIRKGRELIDNVFADAAQFTRDTLDQLNTWVTWIQTVITAVRSSKPAPDFPATGIARSCPGENSDTGSATTEPNTDTDPIHLDLENDREFLTAFVNESREHLQNIESGALALEENPTSPDTLNSIFRAFHTFKGGSGFLNLTPMNKLAHELETLLDLGRQRRLAITLDVVEIILNGGDTLKRFIDAIELQLTGQTPEAPIVIPTAPLRERIALIASTPVLLAQAESPESPTAFLSRAAEPTHATSQPKSTSSAVKVDTGKLDTLIDMVGELVIAQSLVAQDSDIKALANSRITRSLAQLARTTKDLQRTAMSLRMVPIRATFRTMHRVVRDLSVRSGKEVDFILRGEETELDRNIVEEIHDPLLHMIRNSVDHGIEKPDQRVAAGKPATGQITLSSFHQGGNVVIQIKDDGAGLNREKILLKAAALDLVDPKSFPELSDKDVFNFIFAPGFSTAETITDISGRGVGMDVVRRNIEQLRGKIEIQSTPGHGATFSIYLPLTLAIIDGLIVRVGEDRYILPTLSVRESFRPRSEMLSTVHGKGEIVDVRGRLLPLLRLNKFLAAHSENTEPTDPTQAVLVIVESDGAQRCVLVDELLGKQEVVIKSLGDTFQTNPLLAGAAILGDGRVGLILDAAALVHPKITPLSKAA